jgi:RNA polymerase sigma-70 factor (ECF subfamily)
MELSIPWTIASPVAAAQPTRRSQGLTSDDPDLVGRAREGDQVAFASLFEQYHAPILNYLHRMVGDRAMAEDLTQDTFIKAYNALPSTRPDLAFKPWLYRIATNTAISQLRRRKIVQWIPFLPGHDHASEQSVERSVGRRQDIEQTLARLPQHYAAALLLRHYQGLSLAETANALGITENAAKLRLFRARKAFAEIYGSVDVLNAPRQWEVKP